MQRVCRGKGHFEGKVKVGDTLETKNLII